jgi:hypothetical protein
MNRRNLLLGLLGLWLMGAGWAQTTPVAPAAAAPTRVTPFPSGPRPDEIVLTWSADPRSSVSVQWRSSGPTGAVAYLPQDAVNPFFPRQPLTVTATTTRIADPGLSNYPFTYWHTARLVGLRPATEYVYVVGDPATGCWSPPNRFRTAAAAAEPFSFIYMGDAQYGFSRWGALLRAAFRNRPDAAFTLIAGDLVTRGNDRDDWDDFLVHGSEVFSAKAVVPAIGNHECKGGSPRMYLDTFDLPAGAPASIGPERCYAVNYGSALFLVVDSNCPLEPQAVWMDEQLSASQARWKFVMFHHPPYSSEPSRDNKEIREAWVPVFDKHHVDLVFSGHDHAYMRTYPLKGGQRAASAAEGTIYLVSVSGTKMYEQADRDYMEARLTDTIVYSVVDILAETAKAPEQLVFRTFDLDGKLRDEFRIEK